MGKVCIDSGLSKNLTRNYFDLWQPQAEVK